MNKILNLSSKYITSNVRITLKNTFYITLSEIVVKVISFLWIIFLARNLIIAEYGTYSYVNSFILIFALLPDLGTGLIIVREIAKNPKKSPEIIGNAAFINLGLSFLTFLLVIIIALVLGVSEEIKTLIIIASFTLFFSILRSLGIFFFEGTERMKYSALLNTINTFLLIFGGFMGLTLGYGLTGIFIGMLIGTLLSLVITWFLTSRFITPVFRIDPELIKYLLKSGIPLGLAGLASIIYLRIDTIIIGQLLGQESVGIYNVATPFVIATIQIIYVPFVIAVFPVLTRLYNKNNKSFTNGVVKSIFFISLITLPITILIFYLSSYFIPFIFDDKYNQSIPILKILILYVPFISLSAFFYKVLIIMNKQLIYLYISIFGVIISVFLNLNLIPKFHLMGAAYSSVITQIILFITFSIAVYYYLKKENV